MFTRRQTCLAWLLWILLWAWTAPAWAEARRDHTVYFQNTPYELHVYKIHGRKEGPTMMIIGGIQGDEPGGFLSADLYTDLALKQGRLIVVPRANFHSILLFARGPDGDMNRKFGRDLPRDYDSQIVEILEKLMSESDVLLNLHDGGGFYRPTFVSENANPHRYGQSIIADAEEYHVNRNGTRIELGRLARAAIDKINADIDNKEYYFHFMNTRTEEKGSPYAEQQHSATFFALTKYGIPAFGVETSKNLPSLEMKVHQHNLAVNAFMEIFGLIPEQPRIYLEKPKLEYLIISVNNQIPVAVADGQTLFISPGDTIEVVHVEANYDRGLSADIQGVGTLNDYRQTFAISKPTFIVAQKDHMKFGRVGVAFHPSPQIQVAGAGPVIKPNATNDAAGTAPSTPAPEGPKAGDTKTPDPRPTQAQTFQVQTFVVEVNGQRREVEPGGRIEATEGDRLRIVDLISVGPSPKNLVVNFRGFVAKQGPNRGEDRGQDIDTATEIMASYSTSKTEKIFEVAAEEGKKTWALITIRLAKPRLDYLVLRLGGAADRRVGNGQTCPVKPGELIQVMEMKTNLGDQNQVRFQLHGPARKENAQQALTAFKVDRGEAVTLTVIRGSLTLGRILLKAG